MSAWGQDQAQQRESGSETVMAQQSYRELEPSPAGAGADVPRGLGRVSRAPWRSWSGTAKASSAW